MTHAYFSWFTFVANLDIGTTSWRLFRTVFLGFLVFKRGRGRRFLSPFSLTSMGEGTSEVRPPPPPLWIKYFWAEIFEKHCSHQLCHEFRLRSDCFGGYLPERAKLFKCARGERMYLHDNLTCTSELACWVPFPNRASRRSFLLLKSLY